MKNFFSRILRFFKPEPLQIVVLTVLLLVFGTSYFQWRRGTSQTDIDISYKNTFQTGDTAQRAQISEESLRLGEDDENLLLTERIKESAAISLGLSVMTLKSRLIDRKNYFTVSELMQAFEVSPMLPPATRVLTPQGANPQFGILSTSRGAYYVRYRPAPLAFEILAVGNRGLADGAAFVLRTPDARGAEIEYEANPDEKNLQSFAGNFATVYVAPRNLEAYIPPPFSDANMFTQSGWTPQPLRQSEVSPERIAELRSFLENAK